MKVKLLFLGIVLFTNFYCNKTSIGYSPEFYNQDLQKYPKKVIVIGFEE